jgi:hypothetical protein
MTIAMRKNWDCGVVSAANHVAEMTGKDPERMYQEMIKSQPSLPVFRDFWDSPTRQQSMIARLSDQPVGLVPINPLLVPSAVLIRVGLTLWHWVTILSVGHGSYRWHDGLKEIDGQTIEQRFPGAVVILALAIGGTTPMPWKWRLWGWLTWPIRRLPI